MNKQHIVGGIIFSLIVGTAVITASFFIQIPDTKSVTVSDYDNFTYRSDTYCKRKKRKKRKKRRHRRHHEEISEFKINQAVFNVKTGNLSIDTEFNNFSRHDDNYKVALHFFVNDINGTQHLTTEYMEVYVNSFSKREYSSFDWLKNLQSHKNLYIVPEIIDDTNDSGITSPVFDDSNATGILIQGLDNL